jgi:glycosyltransferase involved in cell wall biosynthesis
MFKNGKCCQQQCSSCKQFRRGYDERSAQVESVIGVSRFMLETLQGQGYFRGAHAHVVHNSSPFAAPATENQDGENSISAKPLRFGYMGTLSEAKGVRWLIEQFQSLSFDATLQIAGRGQLNDEAQLRALVTSPNISFVGYQKPEVFYSQIDVAVVPSIWGEPFGMVAVEACAHSVPVIAGRMGGLPEIVEDQVNGLLCSPDDPNTLGQAMLSLHQQPELLARLSAQARSTVAPMIDEDLMLDHYQRIFSETLQCKLLRRKDLHVPHLV